MPFSLALCSSANNPFYMRVVEGVCRAVAADGDARLLSWQGNHLIPPAALSYLSPDALILGALSAEDAARLPADLPKIGFSNSSENAPWPRVVNDDAEVGALAARALLDAGYSSVRVVGESGTHHFRLRAEAAARTVRKAGGSCANIDTAQPAPAEGETFAEVWARRQTHLRETLAALPANTGLLVLSGNLASEVSHLLREELQRAVPEDLGIMVADLVSPENQDLSHVLLPGEEIGRLCVESLLRHLRDPTVPLPVLQTVPPREIHPGHSLREEDAQILYQRLEAWCRKQMREAVTVDQAAAELGLSRRSLEMKLHAGGFPSPYELLTRLRLREACRLLSNTSMRIGDIAEATGFQTARALTNRFRAHHGMSPSQWRKGCTASRLLTAIPSSFPLNHQKFSSPEQVG